MDICGILLAFCVHARSWRELAKCRFAHFPSFFPVHVDTYVIGGGWYGQDGGYKTKTIPVTPDDEKNIQAKKMDI